MIELSKSKAANLLAIVAILSIALGLYLIIDNGNRLSSNPGLSALHASAQGEVVFVSDSYLHQLDAQGQRQHRLSVTALGIDGRVAALAMEARGQLLLISDKGILYRCRFSPADCDELARLQLDGWSNAYALAVDESRGRILIADSKGHHIRALNADGTIQQQLHPNDGLRYPNDISLLSAEQWLVADTNRHRVLVLQHRGNESPLIVEEWAIQAPQASHHWPIAARRDQDGFTWVIAANGLLEKGQLLLYEPGETDGHPLSLPDADPAGLALLPRGMLVADFRHRLLHVDPLSYRVSEYGDPALKEELQVLRAQRQQWEQLRLLGMTLIGLMFGIGVWAGWLDFKTRKHGAAQTAMSPVAPAATPRADLFARAARHGLARDARGIIWIGASRDFLRNIKLVMAVSILMLLASLLLLAFYSHSEFPLELLAPAPVVFALTLWLFSGFRKIAIGTDGQRLYIVDPFGRQAQGTPDAFAIAGRRLVMGSLSIPSCSDNKKDLR